VKYAFQIVDVFNSTPFGGNQLAILPDAAGISTEGMKNIAREFISVMIAVEQRSTLYDEQRGWENAYRPYWRHRTWSDGFLLPAIDLDVRQEERDAGTDHCACRHTNTLEQPDQE
jgi:hypothetical protein